MTAQLPKTVLVSRSGNTGIEIVEYEGADGIPNRLAVGEYFTYKAEPKGENYRVCVIFSRTVGGMDRKLYGSVAPVDEKAERVQMALAAIGDHLDAEGSLPRTPSGEPAFQVECFSYKLMEWRDRKPANDDEIEAYIEARLFWSWKYGHADAYFTQHDLIRLAVPLEDVSRVSQLGEGTRWKTQGASPVRPDPQMDSTASTG